MDNPTDERVWSQLQGNWDAAAAVQDPYLRQGRDQPWEILAWAFLKAIRDKKGFQPSRWLGLGTPSSPLSPVGMHEVTRTLILAAAEDLPVPESACSQALPFPKTHLYSSASTKIPFVRGPLSGVGGSRSHSSFSLCKA